MIAFNMVGEMFGVSTIISCEGGFDEALAIIFGMQGGDGTRVTGEDVEVLVLQAEKEEH